MNYMNIKEAAEKWSISERLIQRLCAEGRVVGAQKLGRAWAIPLDAEKPADPRRSSRASQTQAHDVPSATEKLHFVPMPLLNSTYTPGYAMDSIVAICDPDRRSIALCEYYYFGGHPEKAVPIAEAYLNHADISLRLSASWLYGYANLALDRISNARRAFEIIKSALSELNDNTAPELRALTIFITAGAHVLLHLPIPAYLPPLKESVSLLPPGLKMFALYIQAHQCYLNRSYGTSLGIVEAALAMQQDIYPIPSIYLHLCATMDYINLKNAELARAHLLAAWELATPDDLIEPFGEHHGLLGGMLEAVIKKDKPDDFKRIIAITYSFSSGWRKLHNPASGESIADNLTTTEFAVAMLAARGWTNKEIGSHLGVSPNTVKHHISIVLQKLNITHRDELTKHMLN